MYYIVPDRNAPLLDLDLQVGFFDMLRRRTRESRVASFLDVYSYIVLLYMLAFAFVPFFCFCYQTSRSALDYALETRAFVYVTGLY